MTEIDDDEFAALVHDATDEPGEHGIFRTPYDQYRDRDGESYILRRMIVEADDDHDAEVLPMYVIEFRDGVQIEAWPDELADA